MSCGSRVTSFCLQLIVPTANLTIVEGPLVFGNRNVESLSNIILKCVFH